MLKVVPLNDKTKDGFCALFGDYYAELDCAEDISHLIDEYIIPDLLSGLLKIDMLFINDVAAGFVVYQIDGAENEWNLKEGWGNIREIYVAPEHRKRGNGKFLLFTAEMKLKENGAEKCYCLPYDAAEKFFVACGYYKTEQYNEELDCNVFEKLSLENCECKK